jgi:hypothetical protein
MPDTADPRAGLRRWLILLYAAFAAEHAYGAWRYGTPIRLVGIVPLGLLLLLALWLLARHARAGGHRSLIAGTVVVAVAFVGLAGVLEGGYNHALKLAFHFAGTPGGRLRELFGGPNFVVPDDAVFEVVGTSVLFLAVPVAVHLVRLLRHSGEPRAGAVVAGAGVAASTAAGLLFGGYLTAPSGHAGRITAAILTAALGVALLATAGTDGQTGRSSRIFPS